MRKVWNRPALPVWSLVTVSKEGVPNMNICTYVTSVSMEPKLLLLGVYKQTKTLANIQLSSRVLLQLLTEAHTDMIASCGRKSGNQVVKLPLIEKRHPIKFHNTVPYVADAAGFIELEIIDIHDVGGDHVLVTGKVLTSKNLQDTTILTTEYLKAKKLIR